MSAVDTATDIPEMEVVEEVPPKTANRKSKYDPVIDRTLEVKPKKVRLVYGDSDTAGSRAASIRHAADRRGFTKDNFLIEVRSHEVYLSAV